MKYIYLISFLFFALNSASAQKYVLLDKRMANKPKFSNAVTSFDRYENYIPVEKKYLSQFVKSLEEIATFLSKSNIAKLKDYNLGCVNIKGRVVSLQSGNRFDYVMTSSCDNTKITMHISDAKLANQNNYVFLSTWINYIKKNLKM